MTEPTRPAKGKVHFPKAEEYENISLAIWDTKKQTWIPADKGSEEQLKKILKSQEVFKQAEAGVYHISEEGVYKETEHEYVEISLGYNKDALKEVAKKAAESGKHVVFFGSSKKSWDLLGIIPSILGWINALILRPVEKEEGAKIRYEVKKGFDKFLNDVDEQCKDYSKKITEMRNAISESTPEELNLTQKQYNDLKSKIEQFYQAATQWLRFPDEIKGANLEEGMNNYVKMINDEKYADFIKATEALFPFKTLIKKKWGINFETIVEEQKQLFEDAIKFVQGEGVNISQEIKSSWKTALQTMLSVSKDYQIKIGTLSYLDAIAADQEKSIQYFTFIIEWSERYPKEFYQAFRAQGLSEVEITMFVSACKKALEVEKRMRYGLEFALQAASEGDYFTAYSRYAALMKKEFPIYREGMQNLFFFQKFGSKFVLSRGKQALKPYADGIAQLLVFIKEKEAALKGIKDINIEHNTNVEKRLAFYQEAFSNIVARLGTEAVSADGIKTILADEISSANESDRLYDELAQSHMSESAIYSGMVTFPEALKSVGGEWIKKIKENEKWTAEDLLKFPKLFNDYGKAVTRLLAAKRALDQDPDNRVMRKQLQELWKQSEKEIKRLDAELEKFGGKEKIGSFSDLYNNFVTDLSEEQKKLLPASFINFGEILLKRKEFLDDLKQELLLTNAPIRERLSFPHAQDPLWDSALKKAEWNAEKIKKFEKLYVEYRKTIDELRFYEDLNKKNPRLYDRFALRELAKSHIAKVNGLERRLVKEVGGVKGVRKLTAAIEVMQKSLERSSANETEARQLQTSWQMLEKAKVDHLLEADILFGRKLYQDLGLMTHPVSDIVGPLADEFKGTNVNELDAKYKEYSDALQALISQRQRYIATRDPEDLAKLENFFTDKLENKLSKLEKELDSLMKSFRKDCYEARIGGDEEKHKRIAEAEEIIVDYQDKKALVKELKLFFHKKELAQNLASDFDADIHQIYSASRILDDLSKASWAEDNRSKFFSLMDKWSKFHSLIRPLYDKVQSGRASREEQNAFYRYVKNDLTKLQEEFEKFGGLEKTEKLGEIFDTFETFCLSELKTAIDVNDHAKANQINLQLDALPRLKGLAQYMKNFHAEMQRFQAAADKIGEQGRLI